MKHISSASHYHTSDSVSCLLKNTISPVYKAALQASGPLKARCSVFTFTLNRDFSSLKLLLITSIFSLTLTQGFFRTLQAMCVCLPVLEVFHCGNRTEGFHTLSSKWKQNKNNSNRRTTNTQIKTGMHDQGSLLIMATHIARGWNCTLQSRFK